MDDYKKDLMSKMRALIMEYESVLGADAIVEAMRDALVQEYLRNDDIGIYTRAARYENAATRLTI